MNRFGNGDKTPFFTLPLITSGRGSFTVHCVRRIVSGRLRERLASLGARNRVLSGGPRDLPCVVPEMSKRTAFGRKLRERRGGATVEFVIWIPFFLALLALITDVSLILNLRSRMQVAAWNSGVAYSRHWKTGPEAETMAEDEFDKDEEPKPESPGPPSSPDSPGSSPGSKSGSSDSPGASEPEGDE